MNRFLAASTAVLLSFPLPLHAETGRGALPAVTADVLAEAQSTFIFTFSEDVPPQDVRGVSEQAARAGNGRIKHIYSSSMKGFSAQMNFAAAERLVAQFPQIVRVERDQVATTLITSTTSETSAPWGTLRVNGQICGRPYSRVWVIDTGIELTHPDLSVADASLHFTAYTTANDKNGHGTHVAGTIGARNQGTNAKGVAPRTPVVPVKVLSDRGSGFYSDVIAGIDWVTQQKISACDTGSIWCGKPEAWVANMSLGGPFSQAMNDAVLAAAGEGVRFALAAGNESTDATTRSPASANHANIFTVAASNSSDGWASFSNFGTPVDYIAPGVGVSSTYVGGSYRSLNGTSMAAPHVAALLTLAPDLKSKEGDPPLIVGGVSYTDGTINRTSTDQYFMARYQGEQPQSVTSDADCKYEQKLMKNTTSSGGTKGGPKR